MLCNMFGKKSLHAWEAMDCSITENQIYLPTANMPSLWDAIQSLREAAPKKERNNPK